MPGVPYEMEAMIEFTVISKLKERIGDEQKILKKMLLTTGIPESTLFERLGKS